MVGALLLLTGVSMGINTGWQPTAGGEMEYIIQIEPQLLKSLQPGDDLVSEVPIDLRSVRRYRIVIGTDELPRIRPRGDAAAAAAAARREAASSPQPLDTGRGAVRTFADAANTAPGSTSLNQGKLKGAASVVRGVQPAAELDEGDNEPVGPAFDPVIEGDSVPVDSGPPSEIPKDSSLPAPDALDGRSAIIDAVNNDLADESHAKAAVVAGPAADEFPKFPDRYQAPVEFGEPKRMVPVPKAESFAADKQVGKFVPNNGGEKPQPTVAKQDIIAAPAPAATSSDTSSSAPPRPWLPLVLMSLGFVASVGANVYLVWIWLDTRRRYFQLAHAQRAAT